MKVTRDRARNTLMQSNAGHKRSLLDSFGMLQASPKKTPKAPGLPSASVEDDPLPHGNRYAELIGSLLYLASISRPDISFAVGHLSGYMANPTKQHMAAAKSILRDLKGTPNMGLIYLGDKPLMVFVDLDYAGDRDKRRSTTGFVFTLNGGPTSWMSKRQTSLATSTADAE